MNPDLSLLQPYPFERFARLLEGVEEPGASRPLKLTVGEPQHLPAKVALDALGSSLELLARYPSTRGELALRQSHSAWLRQRHGLTHIDPEHHVLPVNGTREGLFAIAQTCVSRGSLVGCPNPFYQIYEGAALLAGAHTLLLDTTEDNGFLPRPEDISDDQWRAMDLLFLCTPGNPAGAVMDEELLIRFIERALEHDVLLVSDECYSEIYPQEDNPPTGLLAASEACGNVDYRNCISMHSLSKRSNLPGLRSGFAAGDADVMRSFLLYRTYHGCAMPPHHQRASIAAWEDEAHVRVNREYYREKFAAVLPILQSVLDVPEPAGAFYLWPRTPIDDEIFTRSLYAETGVSVLPGSYLGRAGENGNPGAQRVRMALVASTEDCVDAARRISKFAARYH